MFFHKRNLVLSGISICVLLSCGPNPAGDDRTFSLSITTINGYVTRNPDKSRYADGDIVALAASPDSGYTFSHWSGDASGANTTTTVTMNGNKSITAIFTAIPYTLTTNAFNGTVTRNPDKTNYIFGDTITLVAVPNNGYSFSNWSGEASGTNPVITVIIKMNMLVKANCKADSTDPVLDIEGNVYQTVRIGTQVWMAENLRTTKYNDGAAIPFVADSSTWDALATPAYCYYRNTINADSIMKFGALYNWYVVDPANPKKIAPTGWHVPTVTDWSILEKYLAANGYNWDGTTDTTVQGKTAKSLASQSDWSINTIEGSIGADLTENNASGFSALPGGGRLTEFYMIGFCGFWWSATSDGASDAFSFQLSSQMESLSRNSGTLTNSGMSLRLVRD